MIIGFQDNFSCLINVLLTFLLPKVKVTMLIKDDMTVPRVFFFRHLMSYGLFGWVFSLAKIWNILFALGPQYRLIDFFLEFFWSKHLIILGQSMGSCDVGGAGLQDFDTFLEIRSFRGLGSPLLSSLYNLVIKMPIFEQFSLKVSDLASIKSCTLILKTLRSSFEYLSDPTWYSHLALSHTLLEMTVIPQFCLGILKTFIHLILLHFASHA